jgi:hypothetical protein
MYNHIHQNSRNIHNKDTFSIALYCLALLPSKVQIVRQPSTLPRRRKNAIRRRRKRRQTNFRVDIEQRLARAARRPHGEIDVVLLEVFAVEGAGDLESC